MNIGIGMYVCRYVLHYEFIEILKDLWKAVNYMQKDLMLWVYAFNFICGFLGLFFNGVAEV